MDVDYYQRKYVFFGIFGILIFIYLIRLFYIQVVDDQYLLLAEGNAIRKITHHPARGEIFDRNGKLIVGNSPIYDLRVVPEQIDPEMDTLDLCLMLGVERAYFDEKLTKLWSNAYMRRKSSVFLGQLEPKEVAAIQERLFQFPGFYLESRTIRHYTHLNASHVLGYIGEVSHENIEESEGYYRSGDYRGVAGLELSYESVLRGTRGVKRLYVDAFNRVKGKYKNGKYDTSAIAGKDLFTGLDIALQAYAERLFVNKRGALVAIEPSTGEILCLVSAPEFNPSLLTGRKRNDAIRALRTDQQKPLFNRAIMSASNPPGSTIKPFLALQGLQGRTLYPSTIYSCNMGYRLTASQRVGCHSHKSPLNLAFSIETSCNAYYCNALKAYFTKYSDSDEALNNWTDYLKEYGFGSPLGIDLPNERKGILPSVAVYDKMYGNGRWSYSTIISLAIGQGRMGVTPLQLANATAALANRGYYYTPHIGRSIENANIIDSVYLKKRQIGVDKLYFDFVRDAMEKVVISGTARIAQIPGIAVCGKTGTAQNPHGEDHSIFIAFAPKDNPKIALCAYVENGGFGGTWAAPIASLVIEKYLNDSISTNRKWVETRMLTGDLISKTEEEE